MGLAAAMWLGTLLCAGTASAQPNTRLRPDETVLLYAEEFTDPADPVRAEKITTAGFEMLESNEITEGEWILENGNIGNIAGDARFDLYFPQTPNGQMVVVCPGGGYSIVSSYNEGIYAARWLTEHGITAAVVKYRLPNGHHNVPLEDVQNVFRYCRAHASEWGVDQIGVMGFSAGGHLAVTTALMYTDAETRPDFNLFLYSVVTMDPRVTHSGTHDELIGRRSAAEDRSGRSWEEWVMSKSLYDSLEETYSLENQVSSDTAPTFIALSSDDGSVPPENSLRLYKALIGKKVPVEMHIFPYGGHGWGFNEEQYVGEGHDALAYARAYYYDLLERWLCSVHAK